MASTGNLTWIRIGFICLIIVIANNIESTSAMLFYRDKDFQNFAFQAPLGWTDRCTNVPNELNDQISSIRFDDGDNCIRVCEDADCRDIGWPFGGICFVIRSSAASFSSFNDKLSSYNHLC